MRIRGPISARKASGLRLAALAAGDIEALMRLNHEEFGNARMMADEPDDDDDDDEPDDDKAGQSADRDDDEQEKSKSKSKSKDSDDDDDDEDDRLERLRKRMKAADKRADEAERRLRDVENKNKPEVERMKTDLEEVTTERDTLKSELNSLRLQNAFLTANKVSWHDPDDALDVAQRKGYLEDAVDEDGTVDRKALGKALERLSKEKPYLVKAEKKEKDEELPESGAPAGGRSDNVKDDKAKTEQLRRRFPALNR